jgi:hypothetical protein
MKISRALDIRDKMKNAVYSAFSSAKHCKSTAKELNDRLLDSWNSNQKGIPYWVFSYLEGMREVLQNDLYQNHLEFCYTLNGTLYSIRKESDYYYEKHNIDPEQLSKKSTMSGHYWIDTDKPFFVSPIK